MIHNTHPVQLIHRHLDVVGVGPKIIDEFKREKMCSVSNHVSDMRPEKYHYKQTPNFQISLLIPLPTQFVGTSKTKCQNKWQSVNYFNNNVNLCMLSNIQ